MAGTERPMGVAFFDEGRWAVRYERHLAHPPEKVWRALTESEHLEHWMPCDIVGERRTGAPIVLAFWPAQVDRHGIEDPTLPGEIRVWDPPSVFEWTWDTDVLRWELDPVGAGTRLTFTTWLGADPTGAAGAAAGYHVCLDELAELLDTGAAALPDDAVVLAWRARYRRAVAAVEPA